MLNRYDFVLYDEGYFEQNEKNLSYHTYMQKNTKYVLECFFDSRGFAVAVIINYDPTYLESSLRLSLDNVEIISTDLSAFNATYQQNTAVQKEAFEDDIQGKRVLWVGEVLEVYDNYVLLKQGSALCKAYYTILSQDLAVNLNVGDLVKVEGFLKGRTLFTGI